MNKSRLRPIVGDVVLGKEIGKRGKIGSNKYVWALCPKCQEGRWASLYNLKRSRTGGLCSKCTSTQRGEKSRSWKGGRIKGPKGYIVILLQPDDFFYPMAKKGGYVLEHRLVMAKHLGRNLHSWEIVHHKKGVAKDDNRREGLQLVTDDRHKQITILENRIKYLEEKNKNLRERLIHYEENTITKGE